MNRFTDDDLSCNDFLGGRVRLWQPKAGYRAGVDPVLLAASVPAEPGQSVLELGCGAGAAILCLAARIPGLQLIGVELQAAYAELAGRNADDNGVSLDVVQADLSALPGELRQRQFDHVIANPPYYRAGAHSAAADKGRSIALGEETPLEHWIDVAAKRLAPRGCLHMIQKADRLPDMLVACQTRLGSVEVLPLSARVGRRAELVILRARKSGRAAFQLHAPLILHNGDRHEEDGESYTPQVSAVLRDGAALYGFSN
ncbi:tRNA1(Val) (adenine(37)-N6)-methyltransferase [Ruegeria sp.]|uniref:tRNA1(Val) (adenine(37)-N6)-methyltransferase n=1 Tax=Ruegeria sp. TaxID=1879320 RepID=UPI003C7C45F3